MSALGQKRTLAHVHIMSALPPKADIIQDDGHVRFVPKADSCSAAIGGINALAHAASTCRSTMTGRGQSFDAPATLRLMWLSFVIPRYELLREGGTGVVVLGAAPLRRARVRGWISGFGVPADPWPSLVESRCATAAIRRVLRCGATTAR